MQLMKVYSKLTKNFALYPYFLLVLLSCNILVIMHISNNTLPADVNCNQLHNEATKLMNDDAKLGVHLHNVSNTKHTNSSLTSISTKNESSMAKISPHKSKVLCWVLTSQDNADSRLSFVHRTWAKRCNVTLYFSDAPSTTFPNVIALHTPKGRQHLTEKTFAALDYIFKHWVQEADWFLKADDDTYVIVENLRKFVQFYDEEKSSESVMLGHMLRHRESGDLFLSGGAGYVMNRAALRLFSNRPRDACTVGNREQAEDVDLARCMTSLGVSVLNALDRQGRSLFHPFLPEIHLYGSFPEWYRKMNVGGQTEVGLSVNCGICS